MPDIHVQLLRVGEPVPFPDRIPTVHDNSGRWTAVLIEDGMESGHPSVALMVQTSSGWVILETSLLAFQAAGRTMVAMAEAQLGWEMPP